MKTIVLVALVAGADRPAIGFDTDVMPIFTKAGCNGGACHGAAAGRGGFHLSLYGGDADADYSAIVRELEGRRVNLARPADSLLLCKPTAMIEHGGGTRLDYDGADANTLMEWIRLGAERGTPRRVVRFVVEPASAILKPGETIPLAAKAHFDDGSTRIVTEQTVFAPTDADAATIEKAKLRVNRRGQQIVIARYLDQVAAVELLVPMSDEPIPFSRVPRENLIDEEIVTTLEVLRIPFSPRCDNATFLRRLRLDLTGRLPQPEEVRAFLADSSPVKRARKIDELLASADFVDYWTFQLAQLFRLRSPPMTKMGLEAFHRWLREQVQSNTPYNVIARSLLLAQGDTSFVGPANFYRAATDARTQAEYVSETLLGVRLRCANCHNHPLDRWKQDDYHGLAAVFVRLEPGQTVKPGRRGFVTHPRTGETALPRLPGERFLDESADNRAALADWLVDPANPYFARAIVNRLWALLMGRGLVEPVDDFRVTNPPSYPALLDRLAKEFVEKGYDVRQMLRLIAQSDAYGRSSIGLPANRNDDRFYSRALVRPLEAEVLADAVGDATGVPDVFADEPTVTRAIGLVNAKTPATALDALGRCSRDEGCSPSGTTSRGLATKLHLMNGAWINAKIADEQGRLARLLTTGLTDSQVIDELYCWTLSRPPREDERKHWLGAGVSSAERKQVFEDLFWSLLNCHEFQTNH